MSPQDEVVYCSSSISSRVRRPMNAFMIWSLEERKRLGRKNPDLHNAEVSKMLGKLWKMLPSTYKKNSFDEAEQQRLAHIQKYPDYKFMPRRRRKKIRKKQSSTSETSSTSGMSSSSRTSSTSETSSSHSMENEMSRDQPTQSDPAHELASCDDALATNKCHSTRTELFCDAQQLLRAVSTMADGDVWWDGVGVVGSGDFRPAQDLLSSFQISLYLSGSTTASDDV